MSDESQSLVPQQVIRGYAELSKYTGLGRTQTQELIAAGEFPKPKRLSLRHRVWLASDIAKWQADRVAGLAELERREAERAAHRGPSDGRFKSKSKSS